MNQIIVTSDPEFVDLALNELEQATVVQAGEHIADGVYLVTIAGSFWELAQRWSERPPIFVRHICPVMETVPLSTTHSDIDVLQQTVADGLAPFIDDEMTFSVQSRTFGKLGYKRFDINTALARVITNATRASLDVKKPQQIVSVVCVNHGISVDEDSNSSADGEISGVSDASGYLGISLTSHNLSDWAGGMRRFAREDGQVSRSEFKLLEAMEVFGIDLPPRGVALDLGASPGGWTRVLRQHDQYVTAIDPGELDSRIRSDRSVRHKRITAEAYLNDEPDSFDIIVNDMRLDARDSARLMNLYARHIYDHGCAVVTLKLPEQGRAAIIEHAINILSERYKIQGARHLFHNRSEITVHLKPHSKRNYDEFKNPAKESRMSSD